MLFDLGDDRHVIAGTFGGIYLGEFLANGAYRLNVLDEELGSPLAF